jgi:hypothetical protein
MVGIQRWRRRSFDGSAIKERFLPYALHGCQDNLRPPAANDHLLETIMAAAVPSLQRDLVVDTSDVALSQTVPSLVRSLVNHQDLQSKDEHYQTLIDGLVRLSLGICPRSPQRHLQLLRVVARERRPPHPQYIVVDEKA